MHFVTTAPPLYTHRKTKSHAAQKGLISIIFVRKRILYNNCLFMPHKFICINIFSPHIYKYAVNSLAYAFRLWQQQNRTLCSLWKSSSCFFGWGKMCIYIWCLNAWTKAIKVIETFIIIISSCLQNIM